MIEKIYLDMDGVLTDFYGRYAKLYGAEDLEQRKNWDVNWKHWVETEQFKTLDWAQSGQTLYNFVRRLGIPFEILSSSGGQNYFSEIKYHKTFWLNKYGFECPVNIVPGKEFKKDYAKPRHLLIDDSKDNIDEWRAAGGLGILHCSSNIVNTLDKIAQFNHSIGAA